MNNETTSGLSGDNLRLILGNFLQLNDISPRHLRIAEQLNLMLTGTKDQPNE